MLSPAKPLKYLLTRPGILPPADWTGNLHQAYATSQFSNFGPVSRQLETELCQKWGGPSSSMVLASSGTAAIAAPLIANGITGPVICPAFTFAATYSAIKMSGANPVIMDVELDNGLICPEKLDLALIQTDAKCVVLVSPFGILQDFTEHLDVAKRRGAIVVIDSAAGLGNARRHVEENDQVYEAFSLHATKPFCVGEGGLIVSHSSKELAMRSALNFGLPNTDVEKEPRWGINGKMSELTAAIGLAMFENFDAQMQRRRALVSAYAKRLSLYPHVTTWSGLASSTWQVFPMLLPTQDAAENLISHAMEAGMEIRRYYRPSLSTLPFSETLAPCPNAENLAQRMCCAPVYSNASKHEVTEMSDILGAALRFALGTRK
ncbi:MAG: DegT/DnrJ/EryC1/StrS family aminotransferase [Octadecabacter sp.]